MSVPPQLMRQMAAQSGNPPAQAPQQGPASDAARTMPPAAAPFSTPQEKRGLKATAMSNVHIAMTLLEQALPDLGSETPEGQAVLKSLHGLVKIAAHRDNSDLVPAEVMQMVKQMPQMGGGTPVQQELIRQQMQQRASAMRPPGGPPAPGAAPPGMTG